MSKEAFTPEKVRELAIELYECSMTPQNNERLITEWLEQNQPEPVVVGLSDEQLEDLVKGLSIATTDYQFKKRLDFAREWLAAQTFAKPDVGISDTSPKWDSAPEWANWLAQDSDCQWNWYDEQPIVGSLYWNSGGKCQEATDADKHWKQTLQQRQKSTQQVEVGQVWCYTQDAGRNEYSIKSLGKVKVDDVWGDSVTYWLSIVEPNPVEYTRTLSDFLAKFERVGGNDVHTN